MESVRIRTGQREEIIDITREVQKAIEKKGAKEGWVVVFVPHTTAGVTINENADPTVKSDFLNTLARLVPAEAPWYRHREGNSDAHFKAVLSGSSVTVLVQGGRLVLGTWQGIWLCEFDGPRERSVLIQVNTSA